MNKTIEFSINKKNNGERLDIFLSKEIKNLTRSYIKKLIEKNNVKINKIINNSPSTKIKTSDKVIIEIIEEDLKILPSNIELNIVYEDKDLLIINKPNGMVVHPGAGNYKNTLVNALIYRYKNGLSDVNGNLRPGIVHRIDKETSGLLVVAKNNLIELELETGRTHQIRVHLKYKGTSLLGDKQYGKKNIKFKKINKNFLNKLTNLNGQALHAQTLEFIHPTKKKWVSFESKLPIDFKKTLDLLNNLSG